MSGRIRVRSRSHSSFGVGTASRSRSPDFGAHPQSKLSELVDSCAVITGPAIGVVAELHDRMPVIVPKSGYARWLDLDAEEVADLLGVTEADLMSYVVSTLVNRATNDNPTCIKPIS